MTQFMQALQIKTGQTQNVFEPKLWPVGLYIQPLLIEGSGMLSSLWVKTLSGSVSVKYFETTSGNIGEEKVLLASHASISPAMLDPQFGKTDKISIQPFHNKPYCEVTVAGGPVFFGVYLTAVESPTALLAGSGGSPTPVTPSVKFQVAHDAVTVDYPTTLVEIYRARLGGLSGAVVETITVAYTDSTKEFVASAVRT